MEQITSLIDPSNIILVIIIIWSFRYLLRTPANKAAESSADSLVKAMNVVHNSLDLTKDIAIENLSVGYFALQLLAAGVVTESVKSSLKDSQVSVEWDGKSYLFCGDILQKRAGYCFSMQYQLDSESEVSWGREWITFQFSTERKAWLDVKSGKLLDFQPASPLEWMEGIKGNKHQIVDVTGGQIPFKGIIRGCALKNLDIRAKRNILVWTENGNQYTDAKCISLSPPVKVPKRHGRLSHCFLGNKAYAHSVLVVQEGEDLSIDDARQICLANRFLLQIVDLSELRTDCPLDIESNSKPESMIVKNYNSDTFESDARCADLDCKGRHSPDVHILLLRTLDANTLYWVYRHIDMGYKVIFSFRNIHQFRPLMPDYWLTYRDSVVGRLSAPQGKISTATQIDDCDCYPIDVEKTVDNVIAWDSVQRMDANLSL